MTLVLLDQAGEEVDLEFSVSGADPNNPQVKLLALRGYGTTFQIRDFGCRSALKEGTGRKARPITVDFCPACVVKMSGYNYDSQTSPYTILCLQTKRMLFLSARNDGQPVPYADLDSYDGVTRLVEAPSYYRRAQSALKFGQSALYRTGDQQLGNTWPDYSHTGHVSYLTTQLQRPSALEYGRHLLNHAALHYSTVWEMYQIEVARLERVTRAIIDGTPYGW